MREIKFRGKAVGSLDKLNESDINHVNGWVYGNLVIRASEKTHSFRDGMKASYKKEGLLPF